MGEFRQHYESQTVRARAKDQRKHPTRSENALWQALRRHQLGGLKFLRQHPVGPSILDFYCHEKKLAIEIDGGIHHRNDQRERDRYRQKLIEGYGIRFFRCTAEDVENNLPEVLAHILKAAK